MTEQRFIQEFGYNLQRELDDYGMTQKELADAIRVSKSTINLYINGNTMPTLKNVINIAYALDCDIEDLIDVGEMVY